MNTTGDYSDHISQLGALKERLADALASQLIENPEIASEITRLLDDLTQSVETHRRAQKGPADEGLGALVGIGTEAADRLKDTYLPPPLRAYDEGIASERIIAVGDLYYIYQLEKIGVFRVVLKLQELFKAGTVRLSSGDGAFGLYQYDRRRVLRHTSRDRLQAYRRVFGYSKASPPPGSKANRDFHHLLINFAGKVARYYRDKRISEVIRPHSDRATFGSVAVVRRAGLDLRNNLKTASYGHVNVLRVEVLQLLEEAFRILGSEDIRKLFGADNAWDVIEDVSDRHLKTGRINVSQRNRMAIAGRNVLRWLSQPHVLTTSRPEFEALLHGIADDAEEWLTSAEALGMARGQASGIEPRGAETLGEELELEPFDLVG